MLPLHRRLHAAANRGRRLPHSHMSHVLNRKGMAPQAASRATSSGTSAHCNAWAGRDTLAPFRRVSKTMRMSQEKSRRLPPWYGSERAKRWIPIASGPRASVRRCTPTCFEPAQPRRPDSRGGRRTSGTVTGMTRAGPRSAIAHVHLDDGRDVDALSQLSIIPPARRVTWSSASPATRPAG